MIGNVEIVPFTEAPEVEQQQWQAQLPSALPPAMVKPSSPAVSHVPLPVTPW
jgi:hypothetical protein